MAKALKICLVMFALFLIVVTITTVTLMVTIFKPKDPHISMHLSEFNILSLNLTMKNATLGMVITISNPNHGSFKNRDSIGHINYHDTIVGEVPIEAMLVPPHSVINVTTSAIFMIEKLTNDPKFLPEVSHGMAFNLTSTAELHGKAIVLKLIKLKATTYNSCDISVNVSSNKVESNCITKMKLS